MGFILKTGEIVEVENICEDPENGFEIRGEDLLKYIDDVEAGWHTHPNATANLSVGDHQSFLNFKDWRHYIVGTDGVTCYVVENGKVIIA